MQKNLKYAITFLLIVIGQRAAAYQVYGDTTIDGAGIIAPGTKPKMISKQFSFTEGPAVDKHGNIFFTDQPNNKIWKYSTDGKLSVFLDSAGRSNGMYFDQKGNLIACADEHNQLWSISPKGKVTVLVSNYKGKLLNGPNDVWVDPKGGIYITDPYYKRDYWTRKTQEIATQNVFYLPKGKKEILMVSDDLAKPNGIQGTPDGKFLYVADIKSNKTYKYPISANGMLGTKQLFAQQGSDGLTLDNRGNVYLTGNGVTVYNPKGKKILHIDIPEKWTANICFGGKNRSTLFITSSEAIYTIPTLVKGVE